MAFRKEFRHLLGRKLLRHCESAPNGDPLQISGCGSRTYKGRKAPPLPPFASCYDKLAAAAPLTDRARKEAPWLAE
jgi:hypothetical protein